MSGFVFIDDVVLRSNLDTALDHVNELVTVSESKNNYYGTVDEFG